MKKNLIYIILLFCVSLVGSQNTDSYIGDSSIENIYEIVEEHLESFEYTITEYTHEQSATRPTNVQVPSITRTSTAHRPQNSNSHTGSAYKADINAHNYTCALNYSDSRSLISGFTDSSTYFKSLCRLLI